MGTTERASGRFSIIRCDSRLILHITDRLAAGDPLYALKLEELKIVKLACNVVMRRGLELMLVRETLHNTGVSDNTILNRKTCPEYWSRLYRHLRTKLPAFPFHEIFHERTAAALSATAAQSPCVRAAISAFVRHETGMQIDLPPDLLSDGNLLFSLGAVHGYRFFRLVRFFNTHWGKDDREPAIRLICQKLWFFYLIARNGLTVSRAAFAEQRTDHENGVFSFIIEDYRNFNGVLYREPHISVEAARKAIRELTTNGDNAVLD